MTDEEIKTTIAKACPNLFVLPNFKADYHCQAWFFHHPTLGWKLWDLDDLNPMHELEKEFKTWERQVYCEFLTSDAPDGIWNQSWQMIHATARQRADAFIKTIGKWKP